MGRRTPTGNWNGKCCWPVFAAQSPPTLPTLAYHALVPDAAGLMTPVLVGPGTVSEGRFSDILLPDYQSVHKTFGSGDLGWEGGRVVSGPEVYATDDGGQPLPEMPWLVHAPQFTNYVPYARDLSAWTGGNAPISGKGDIEGGLDAFACNDVQPTGTTNKTVSGSMSSMSYPSDYLGVTAFGAKAPGALSAFQQYNLFTPNSVANPINIDNFNGNTFECPGHPSSAVIESNVSDAGNFFRFTYTARYTAASGNATWAFRLIPKFAPQIDTCAEDFTLTGEGWAFDGIMVCKNLPAAQLAITPPIITTGAAATRDTCALALTELHTVWNNTEGTLYLETAITGDSAVLSSAGLDFLSINSSEPVLTDGTNTAVVAVANPSKIGIAYSAAGMAVNADGVWGTTVPYDGSMVSTLVELFKAGAVVQKARNIQYKDAEDRAWLDQEMAA